jgi:hypothetical protein
VTFLVGKELFPAHKVILSARSNYFHALFSNRMQSLSSGPIELDIDPVIFSVILKWIYTDEIDLDSLVIENERLENSFAWQLWMSSNYLCLHSLLSVVEQHLITSLNFDNVCYFWNHVQSVEAATLQHACKDFFIQNLHAVIDTPGFHHLDRKLVLEGLCKFQSPSETTTTTPSNNHSTSNSSPIVMSSSPSLNNKRKLSEENMDITQKKRLFNENALASSR